MAFTPADLKDPNALERVRKLFSQAAFLHHVGIQLTDVGPGWADTSMTVAPHHFQAEGFVHAGVQATIADHTAGAAAGTLASAEQVILAVEFKINLLRPGLGERITCRAEVLKAGKRLMVCEARVNAWRGSEQKLVATLTSTIAVVPARGES
jgi:uncharacterized protein (TIGR00369 family)